MCVEPDSKSINNNHSVACVVVTYRPDFHQLCSLIDRLTHSGVYTTIVNNHYSVLDTEQLYEKCSRYSKHTLELICLDRNYGIAHALNLGIQKVKDAGFAWVLLLDQDSMPQTGLFDELESTIGRIKAQALQVGAMGVRLFDPRSKQFLPWALLRYGIWKKTVTPTGTNALIACEFINSSGSIINIDVFNRVGPFRDSFFIDHVETEWYMRARHLQVKCYGFDSTHFIVHHMGDYLSKYWFFGWRYIPRRSPERHYTIVRNALWMWRLKHVSSSWKVNSAVKICFTLVYFGLFDMERQTQIRFILKGIKDGLNSSLEMQA